MSERPSTTSAPSHRPGGMWRLTRALGRSHRAVLALIATAALLVACGGTPPPGGGGGGGGGGGFRSNTCGNVTGLPAAYWDFMNGEIRADYPRTYQELPYVGSPFIHPVQPLYSFMYPPGWTAVQLTDASAQLTGANVVRGDGIALWRRLNFTLAGFVPPSQVLGAEFDLMRGNLGLTAPLEVICAIDAGSAASGAEAASRLVNVEGFTVNINVQVYYSNALGPSTTVFVQMALAPSADYANTALNVFFPLSGQMLPGGGGDDPQCSDDEDNDGDGETDFPDDPGCDSPDDDTEAG